MSNSNNYNNSNNSDNTNSNNNNTIEQLINCKLQLYTKHLIM